MRMGGKVKGKGGRPIAAVELALTILIGLVAARIILTLAAPGPSIGDLPPPPLQSASLASIGDPFRVAEAPAPVAPEPTDEDAVETSLDLALHGTWVEGDHASAIIKTPDGAQKTFFVGDEICCGAILENVYPDRILIARGGAREVLRLPRVEAATAPPLQRPAAAPARQNAPSQQAGPAATSQSLADIMRMEPSFSNSGISQVRLFAGRNDDQFRSLGFKDGDILVAIDGTPLPTDGVELAKMLDSLKGAGSATFTVKRNGVQTPIKATLSAGAAKSE